MNGLPKRSILFKTWTKALPYLLCVIFFSLTPQLMLHLPKLPPRPLITSKLFNLLIIAGDLTVPLLLFHSGMLFIMHQFYPAVLGGLVSKFEVKLFDLAACACGLGISDPVSSYL